MNSDKLIETGLVGCEESGKKDLEDNSIKTAFNKIESDLNRHLHEKKGSAKYKKVALHRLGNDPQYYENTFKNITMQLDENRNLKKKWNGLPMYAKWKCIIEYFKCNKIDNEHTLNSLKEKLLAKKLNNINYDHNNGKILSINSLEFT